MVYEQSCPFCSATAAASCPHLAVAVEGRDFVKTVVQLCEGEKEWQAICSYRKQQRLLSGEWRPDEEDFTWLETAFAEQFLKPLRWFGGMEYEWRNGPAPGQGGFWVLVWSKDPRRLWWELRDELEKQRRTPTLSRPPADVAWTKPA